MDRDECHGIRELLVLLTHLHNDQHSFLIIDEPELHLHPQFQSYFIQEARKVAAPPAANTSRMGLCLITHSPLFLIYARLTTCYPCSAFPLTIARRDLLGLCAAKSTTILFRLFRD